MESLQYQCQKEYKPKGEERLKPSETCTCLVKHTHTHEFMSTSVYEYMNAEYRSVKKKGK